MADDKKLENKSVEPDISEFVYLLLLGSVPIIITILIAYFLGTTNQTVL